jgi:putative transcriptional regulator
MAMIVNHVSRLLGERRESVKDLQRSIDVAYATAYSLYKGDATRVDLAILNKLCVHFGVGVGQILEYVPDEPAADVD